MILRRNRGRQTIDTSRVRELDAADQKRCAGGDGQICYVILKAIYAYYALNGGVTPKPTGNVVYTPTQATR